MCVSLYKYLGAGAGAKLCGSAEVLEGTPHLVKVHGGTMFRNWHNAAVALHVHDGFEGRCRRAIRRAAQLVAELNRIDGLHIEPFERGSNVFMLRVTGADPARLRKSLQRDHGIALRSPAEDGAFIPLEVNESLLGTTNERIVAAFRDAYDSASRGH